MIRRPLRDAAYVRSGSTLALVVCVAACAQPPSWSSDPPLLKERAGPLWIGEHIPDVAEIAASGALTAPIRRGSHEFRGLVHCESRLIVVKDEERSGDDSIMTDRLCARLRVLAELVAERYAGVKLRVTDAWDSRSEHSAESLHYAGRAADLTTSDADPRKLGELARLAVKARCDWVYYENTKHVHVSVAE